MKILYITDGKGPDYLSDSIFHGLRSIYGNNIVDSHCLTFMYKQYSNDIEKAKLYGRGFTLYATIDDDNTDRTDLFNKIRKRYFDLIIYGSAWRCLHYFKTVNEIYPKRKIILLDGEDHTILHTLHKEYPYFKRELIKNKSGLFPISFSFPQEKITSGLIKKDKEFATVIPGDKLTYIFGNEEEYYHDYARSYYGISGKRGGWDCLRHYEILGNYCVPYIKDISKCPALTMFNFPKDLCVKTNLIIESRTFDKDIYFEILDKMFQYFKENLTTENVSKYLLNRINHF